MSTAFVLHEATVQGRVASNESGAGDAVLARTAVIPLTANPTAGDTYDLFKLPKGAVVTSASIRSTALETNASPTLAVELGTHDNGAGDTGGAATLVALTVAAQNKGFNAVGGIDTSLTNLYYQDVTTVFLTFQAVAATFAAGEVVVTVEYKTPGLLKS